MVGTFIAGCGAEMLRRTLQYISMVGVALVLAASIGVSLGVVISGHERVAPLGYRSRVGPVHGPIARPVCTPRGRSCADPAGGGLGHFIVERMTRASRSMVTGGTIAITVVGLAVNDGLLLVEEALTLGTRERRERT